MNKFSFIVNQTSNSLKFQQLVDAVNDAVNCNLLRAGDQLPSVNQVCNDSNLSRDTVFKAYNELKKQGLVESVPNRGYFINKTSSMVLLFLDTFKAYKEVLYASFIDSLPGNVSVDLHFHHYNIDVFERTIKASVGKCSRYIVMNFDHKKVPKIVQQIPAEKLLLIDWDIHSRPENSYLRQDFGQPVYDCLKANLDIALKYERFIYLYPEFTYHPKISQSFFTQFIGDHHLNGFVMTNYGDFKVRKGDLYLLVSDRTLARFLDQCAQKKFIPGVDVGVISYNDTPMKKYVKEGITVLSTDFEQLGRKASEFAQKGQPMQVTIPTKLIRRNSA